MIVVGLTGGIGSGKTTVAEMLRRLGAPIVDADQLAREVVAPGQPALARIRAAFGPDVLRRDGTLDRPQLARLVFSDADARRRLEAITHPRIEELARERLAALDAAGVRACVLVVPLLFEAGMAERGVCDQIWVVRADPAVQLKRVMARDGLDERAARARLDAQGPLAVKVARADVVIDNDGGEAATRAQVEAAWALVLARVGGG